MEFNILYLLDSQLLILGHFDYQATMKLSVVSDSVRAILFDEIYNYPAISQSKRPKITNWLLS